MSNTEVREGLKVEIPFHHSISDIQCSIFIRGFVLYLLPQIFKNNIPHYRGSEGYLKIAEGKNIIQRPPKAFLLAVAGAVILAHQQIGVKQENNKPHLDQGPQNPG